MGANYEPPAKKPVGEICFMSSPSIIVSLEMEIGNETIPVLVMQASLTGQVKDWSTDVSSLSLHSRHKTNRLIVSYITQITIIKAYQ